MCKVFPLGLSESGLPLAPRAEERVWPLVFRRHLAGVLASPLYGGALGKVLVFSQSKDLTFIYSPKNRFPGSTVRRWEGHPGR